ncbi:MAG: DUF3822 family protein [Bacteroidales bacterium]|nr:DUF3822 family protein [Bacteroidales bacterium]
MTCTYRYIDPSIGNYYISDLLLNITFGSKRIFLSVTSIKTKKNLAICNYIFPPIDVEDTNQLIDNLSKLQATEKILSPSIKYKNITYTVLDYRATLIPKKYFDEKEKEKYLKILFPQDKGGTVFVEKIPQIKAVAISAISPAYPAAISIPYGEAKYRSVYSILIQKIFTLPEKSRFATQVLLHIGDSAFELTVKKSNKLIFINTFSYSRKSDILYYFLYTLNKLGLDMGAIAVFLCGKAREINLLGDIKIHTYHSAYYKDNDEYLLVT